MTTAIDNTVKESRFPKVFTTTARGFFEKLSNSLIANNNPVAATTAPPPAKTLQEPSIESPSDDLLDDLNEVLERSDSPSLYDYCDSVGPLPALNGDDDWAARCLLDDDISPDLLGMSSDVAVSPLRDCVSPLPDMVAVLPEPHVVPTPQPTPIVPENNVVIALQPKSVQKATKVKKEKKDKKVPKAKKAKLQQIAPKASVDASEANAPATFTERAFRYMGQALSNPEEQSTVGRLVGSLFTSAIPASYGVRAVHPIMTTPAPTYQYPPQPQSNAPGLVSVPLYDSEGNKYSTSSYTLNMSPPAPVVNGATPSNTASQLLNQVKDAVYTLLPSSQSQAQESQPQQPQPLSNQFQHFQQIVRVKAAGISNAFGEWVVKLRPPQAQPQQPVVNSTAQSYQNNQPMGSHQPVPEPPVHAVPYVPEPIVLVDAVKAIVPQNPVSGFIVQPTPTPVGQGTYPPPGQAYQPYTPPWANDELKSGGSSCHQCKTRFAPSLLVYCGTSQADHSRRRHKRKRDCRKKYCQKCVARFYHESASCCPPDWACPGCRNICSCAECKRKRGNDVDRSANLSLPTFTQPNMPPSNSHNHVSFGGVYPSYGGMSGGDMLVYSTPPMMYSTVNVTYPLTPTASATAVYPAL